MLDDLSCSEFPKVENNNDWSCYYYADILPKCVLGDTVDAGRENKWSSCSSSSSDESDSGIRSQNTTPRTKSKIKKKLRARDRDNEIDFVLKRKSLKLCRQSSNGSACAEQYFESPCLSPKKVLSRQNSQNSNSSNMEIFRANPGGNSLGIPVTSSSPQPVLPSIQNRVVAQLAKSLRANCDKILDMSVPFVLDSCVLWTVSEAINELVCNNPMPEVEDSDDGARSEYIHQVLFLSDVLEQTPSLCISLSDMNSMPGSLDLTFFRNLQVLELRKIPPHMVSGLNTIRINLKKLKCTRCLDSLQEIFAASTTAEILPSTSSSPLSPPVFPTSSLSMTLTSVWPELKEIDVSFNRIDIVETTAFELTPSVEVLNLSRNRISFIDPGFSRVLTCLAVLNLNYNQLTSLPPVPPCLKVLLLSNNYISTLNCAALIGNLKNLEMLDVSQNMISNESQLEPLRNLTSLKSLVCIGNPVSYLDNYRNILCGNLSRTVLMNRAFILDKKKISNSEIRLALEKVKLYRPAPLIMQPLKSSSFAPFPFQSSSSGGNRDRLCDLKSLTQSYDSSSSSVRSACRKKAKIREIVVLDGEDDVDECFSSSLDSENRDPKMRNRKGSQESTGSSASATDTLSQSEKSDILVLETRNAIANLRDKYGNDNWLLRQAGCEVGKLIGISDKVTKLAALSKSLPVSRDSTFYSAVAIGSWENTSMSRDKSSETLGSNSGPDTSESDDSIKQLDYLSNSFEGTGIVYQSCLNSENDSINNTSGEGCGTFTDNLSYKPEPDELPTEHPNATHFRFFQSGRAMQLSILNNFLFEVDPNQKDVILSKWDLKSLKSVSEEKFYSEAETIEFRLSFDTMRKHLRERTFVMSKKEYNAFNDIVTPFLQVKTLQEFADGFQCVKCNAQFSKGMADVKIVDSAAGVPTEVRICPNSECRSDLLIPLESIPLPNNETLKLTDADFPSWRDQPRSSTPISGLYKPNSLPKAGFFPPSLEQVKSNSTFNRVFATSANKNTPAVIGSKGKFESAITAEEIIAGHNSAKTGKSDSDIEVLSCDSSSIEVLGKAGGSGSSSDIDVEEAVEMSVPDFILNSGKAGHTVPMTESNSSGSCTESVCTTYERAPCPPLLSISQQLSPAANSPSSSLVGSTTSSTLTPSHSISVSASFNPTQSLIPIRYDYENFGRVDHRLQLFCEISIFKYADERLVALTKAVIITSSGVFVSVVIFSNKKVYFYKIICAENDHPEEWLQKVSCFPLGKLTRLDVLIGRQGVGLDFSGKLHALVFRDSTRTSKFIEFFLGDICAEIESPPLVRDLCQTQKAQLSSTNPTSYFGILRFAVCEAADKTYSVSGLVLTDEDLILVSDLGWLVSRNTDNVNAKHTRSLSTLRQVECLEVDTTFVKLVFEVESLTFWDVYFETQNERDVFIECLKGLTKDIQFITLSQPLEP